MGQQRCPCQASVGCSRPCNSLLSGDSQVTSKRNGTRDIQPSAGHCPGAREWLAELPFPQTTPSYHRPSAVQTPHRGHVAQVGSGHFPAKGQSEGAPLSGASLYSLAVETLKLVNLRKHPWAAQQPEFCSLPFQPWGSPSPSALLLRPLSLPSKVPGPLCRQHMRLVKS